MNFFMTTDMFSAPRISTQKLSPLLPFDEQFPIVFVARVFQLF